MAPVQRALFAFLVRERLVQWKSKHPAARHFIPPAARMHRAKPNLRWIHARRPTPLPCRSPRRASKRLPGGDLRKSLVSAPPNIADFRVAATGIRVKCRQRPSRTVRRDVVAPEAPDHATEDMTPNVKRLARVSPGGSALPGFQPPLGRQPRAAASVSPGPFSKSRSARTQDRVSSTTRPGRGCGGGRV